MTILRAKIIELPFIRQVDAQAEDFGHTLDLWHVEPSGDWSADCRTDREYARLLLKLVRDHGAYPLVGQGGRAAVRSGPQTGLSAGFSRFIAERAAQG